MEEEDITEVMTSDGVETFPTPILETSAVGPESPRETRETEGGGGKACNRQDDKENDGAGTFPTPILETSAVGPESPCETGETEGGGVTETTTRKMRKLVVEEDEIPRHRCRRPRRFCPSANIRSERWGGTARRPVSRRAYMEGGMWPTRRPKTDPWSSFMKRRNTVRKQELRTGQTGR